MSERRPTGLATLARVLTGLALVASTAAPADAETRPQRFERTLSELRDARGPLQHVLLADAQGLASSVPGGWERLKGIAEDLASRGSSDWIRGEAHGTLAAARHFSDPEAARRHVLSGGVIATGAILGPLSGAGGGASLPEGGFDPSFVTEGQRGSVSWRAFEGATLAGPLQIDDLLAAGGDTHAFIIAALDVKRPTDAMVVAGSNGDLGVWLNGTSLVEWNGERSLTDWQHPVPVRLQPGTHHLAVRVGHRSVPPQLLLRLIDRRGLLPAGVTLRPPKQDDRLASWRPSRRLPSPLAVQDALPLRLRGRLALLIDDAGPEKRRAAELLSAAIEESPDDAELYYLLALAESGDDNRAVSALGEALRLSGGTHAAALGALLRRYRVAHLDARADATARRLAALAPGDPAAVAHDVWRVIELADAGAALARLEAIAARTPLPAHNGRLSALWANALEQSGRHAEAAAAWAKVARLSGADPAAVGKAIAAARRMGDDRQAVRWLDEALARRPYAVEFHILKARTLASSALGPEAGLLALARIASFHDQSPELLETRGRLLLLAGDKGAALTAFDAALALQPQNRELSDYRRSLVAGRSMAQAWAVDVAEFVGDAAREAATAAPQGATYLLDKHAVQVFASGLSSHFQQQVIRIDGDRAAERFEQRVFPYTPGEDRIEVIEAEVIHPDGTRSRPREVFDHQPKGKQMGVYTLRAARVIRFEGLDPGDVLHLQVRKDEIGGRNLFGDFFGVFLPIQEDFPKQRVEIDIVAPTSRDLFAGGRAAPAPRRTTDETANTQRLSWRLSDLAALAIEPRMPGYGDVGAYINVSTFKDWKALADWYRQLVAPQLEPSPDIAETARALAAPREGLRDKVAAILGWVLANTRYVGIEFGIHGFKPYRVTDVVERGYGDCKDKTSLLLAMLAEVGIKAEFVLVRTRDYGSLEAEPATLWAFNHAIAYIPALDLYLDGTSEFSGLDELPTLDQGARVLRIDISDPSAPPVLTHIPMSTPQLNLVRSEGRYDVRASGDAAAVFKETIHGTQAPRLRSSLQDATRRDEILAAILSRQHSGAKLVRAGYAHLDDLGVPVEISAEVELPAFARVTAKQIEVPAMLQPGMALERYGTLSTRAQPLTIDHPVREADTSTFHLPRGATLQQLPAPVQLDGPFGSYSMSYTRTPGGYVIDIVFELRVSEVSPSDYQAFRDFLQKVAAAERQRVRVLLP